MEEQMSDGLERITPPPQRITDAERSPVKDLLKDQLAGAISTVIERKISQWPPTGLEVEEEQTSPGGIKSPPAAKLEVKQAMQGTTTRAERSYTETMHIDTENKEVNSLNITLVLEASPQVLASPSAQQRALAAVAALREIQLGHLKLPRGVDIRAIEKGVQILLKASDGAAFLKSRGQMSTQTVSEAYLASLMQSLSPQTSQAIDPRVLAIDEKVALDRILTGNTDSPEKETMNIVILGDSRGLYGLIGRWVMDDLRYKRTTLEKVFPDPNLIYLKLMGPEVGPIKDLVEKEIT